MLDSPLGERVHDVRLKLDLYLLNSGLHIYIHKNGYIYIYCNFQLYFRITDRDDLNIDGSYDTLVHLQVEIMRNICRSTC